MPKSHYRQGCRKKERMNIFQVLIIEFKIWNHILECPLYSLYKAPTLEAKINWRTDPCWTRLTHSYLITAIPSITKFCIKRALKSSLNISNYVKKRQRNTGKQDTKIFRSLCPTLWMIIKIFKYIKSYKKPFYAEYGWISSTIQKAMVRNAQWGRTSSVIGLTMRK